MHMSRTRLVAVENTHNSSGGRCWTLEEIDDVVTASRELDLKLHLDGARLLNASTATGVSPAEYGRRFDTVTLCLSKGLGCPLGALLATSDELSWKARRGKHLIGGAMRQAGIVASAGLVRARPQRRAPRGRPCARAAARARRCTRRECPSSSSRSRRTSSRSMSEPLGLTRSEALARLKEHGVLLSTTVWPTKLRAVTHLDVDDDDVDAAIEAMPRALGALARV